MNIQCPRCSNNISTDDLNIQQLIAKCDSCDTVFNFAEQIDDATWLSGPAPTTKAPRPEKVKQDRSGLDLILRWRWLNASVIFLIPFTIFWNAIMFGFVTFSAPFASGSGDGPSGIFALLPLMALPHVAIGLGLIYYLLCMFLNQTRVQINSNEIAIRHTPLPWPGAKTLPATELEQLYTKEKVTGSQRSQTRYEVHLIDGQGAHRKLLGGLDSAEHALYLEQEIERYFDIQNQTVRGAYA